MTSQHKFRVPRPPLVYLPHVDERKPCNEVGGIEALECNLACEQVHFGAQEKIEAEARREHEIERRSLPAGSLCTSSLGRVTLR